MILVCSHVSGAGGLDLARVFGDELEGAGGQRLTERVRCRVEARGGGETDSARSGSGRIVSREQWPLEPGTCQTPCQQES